MKLRFIVAALAALIAPACAIAEQNPPQVSETSSAFNIHLPTTKQTWDNIAKWELNPALRALASNNYGSSCSAVASPTIGQWCVDATQRLVFMYTQPIGVGAPGWHQALAINPDGSFSVPTIVTMPAPTSIVRGGVFSASAPSNQFQTGIDTTGLPTFAQPAFSNLSGSLACSQKPALTGVVTSSAGSCATTFASNPVFTGTLTANGQLLTAPAGVVADSTTDISGALNSALAAGDVILPATTGTAFYRASATIVVPPGSALEGRGDPSMPTTIYKGGAKIVCDATVSPCILNGANVTGGASGRISNISQSRAGSTPSAASGYIGIQNMAGLSNKMDHVTADNNSICYLWRTPPGTGNGISSVGDYLFSSRCSDVHVWQDGWPEIRIANSRFGSNGGEVASNAFIRLSCTQHNCGGAGAPNTMSFSNTQFNTNGPAVLKFMELTDLGTGIETAGGPDAGLPSFTNVHAENFMQFLTSDSSWDAARSLSCAASGFYVGSDTFALSASTSVDNWNFNGCNFIGTGAGTFTFNLNPSGNSIYTGTPKRVLTRLQMNGGIIGGAGTITGQGASNSMASFIGVSHGGTFTLAGRWANLSVVGGNWTAGNLTDSTNTADDVTIMENNVFKFHGNAGVTCGAGISATTGRTYKGLITAC